MHTIDTEPQEVYTVTRLNNEIRLLLEDQFPMVWVEGEISNFAAPHSGHWYFSLKDDNAQVRCAMFKGSQKRVDFVPKNGLHILIRARASLYPNRGEYQLIAEQMEERGEGKLRRAFELLKKKLEAAGLFHLDHKKSLPLFPQQIGVITSATGAAIHDILHVLKRRFACVPVIIYPTLVQGELAAPAIVKAIQLANERNECDVLILARGGGSLEDLWPFNEEMVAHAVYGSNIPLISGVGHEVDFTIADFVSDKRAPTPSAAAEMITPDQAELLLSLQQHEKQLLKCMRHKLFTTQQHLSFSQKHLYQQHPKRKLSEKMQKLDFNEVTLTQLKIRLLTRLKNTLNMMHAKLQQLTPLHRIETLQKQLQFSHQHVNSLMMTQLNQQKTRLATAATQLNALSPLATLERGYAIATNKQQQVIYSAKEVKKGEEISVRVRHALLDCKVENIQVKD